MGTSCGTDPSNFKASRQWDSSECTSGMICDADTGKRGAVYITRNENTTFSNSQAIIEPGFVALSVEKQFATSRPLDYALQSGTCAPSRWVAYGNYIPAQSELATCTRLVSAAFPVLGWPRFRISDNPLLSNSFLGAASPWEAYSDLESKAILFLLTELGS